MTGIARRLLSHLASVSSLRALGAASVVCVVACGAPATTEGAAPATPKSSAPDGAAGATEQPTPATTQPPAAAAPASDPSATTAWPLGPAPSADELKAQADRLAKDPGPIRTNWTPPSKNERYGRAEGLIAAPYDAVKARLLDFPHYKELAGPKFKKVSVVDKSAAGTDLYFQLPIMKGLVTIWYVTRFSAARPGMAGAEIVEGKFVKGNIKDMQIVFTIRPTADQKTILVCDLNLALSIPAPQSALDEELRDACGDAVNAIRARTTQPPP
jgi:hypothetical protein